VQVLEPVFQPNINEFRYELEITYDKAYQRSYYFDNFVSLTSLLNTMALEGILFNSLVALSISYSPGSTN
jgi:hypothetical protein